MKTNYLMTLCMALVVGGAVITGLANALGKADEEAPIADASVVNGLQIHVEIKNGQVMLRRQVNVDAAVQTVENIANGLDGGKSVRDDPEGVALSAREAVEYRQGSMEFDDKSRAALSPGLHADRVKLMIIYSLYLRSMSPLGHV
jgi:osmotically-inducible protein OsmY